MLNRGGEIAKNVYQRKRKLIAASAGTPTGAEHELLLSSRADERRTWQECGDTEPGERDRTETGTIDGKVESTHNGLVIYCNAEQ